MVMCKDCGLYGVRDVDGTRLLEADETKRRFGTALSGRHWPICQAQARDFEREANSLPQGTPNEKISTLIKARIECPEYLPWRKGFSPKEHREAADRVAELNRIDERDAEFRAFWMNEASAFKTWREDQARDDQAWREKIAKSDRRWRLLELVIGMVLIPIVAVGLAHWLSKQ